MILVAFSSDLFRRALFAAGLAFGLLLSALRADTTEFIPHTIRPDARNLDHVARKIREGETVRIGFLGGSITQGAGAKRHADSYYWQTKTRLTKFAEKSGANVESVLAAVGGTGSDYGAHRVGLQLLDKNLDLLVVEFAVNDFQNPNALDGMEGIVRQALAANPRMGVVLFYTANRRMIEEYYHKGALPPSIVAFHRVARHYDLAEVNAGPKVWELLASNRSTPELFFPDKTHPSFEGHTFYAELLSDALIAALQSASTPSERALPAPLGSGRFERATLMPLAPLTTSGEWTQGKPGYYTYFGVWKSSVAGSSLTVEVSGERVVLLCGKVDRLRVTGPGIDKVLRSAGRRNSIPTFHSVFDDAERPFTGRITLTVEAGADGKANAEIAGLAVIRPANATKP
jgi:Lysophospholipase L1 and related esterases